MIDRAEYICPAEQDEWLDTLACHDTAEAEPYERRELPLFEGAKGNPIPPSWWVDGTHYKKLGYVYDTEYVAPNPPALPNRKPPAIESEPAAITFEQYVVQRRNTAYANRISTSTADVLDELSNGEDIGMCFWKSNNRCVA